MPKSDPDNRAKYEDRVRKLLRRRKGFEEKRMFGGLGFLLQGNMCCGIHKGRLIFRLGTDVAEAALKEKHVKPFDITGRPMRGWVMIDCRLIANEDELKNWVALSASFASKLPAK